MYEITNTIYTFLIALGSSRTKSETGLGSQAGSREVDMLTVRVDTIAVPDSVLAGKFSVICR